MYNWIGLWTLFRKEVWRFLRIWTQTLLPSAITMALYFVIFGHIVGSQLKMVAGHSYLQYIAPGLMMMAIVNNAYSNATFSFYVARFHHSIEELLVAPMPNLFILMGYVGATVVRAFLVAILIAGVARFFTHLPISHLGIIIAASFLAACLFALTGLLNGMLARSFDDANFVPTFILTPLTYLGGVFYSINILPPFWYHVSLINPVLYIVNAFRYGWLGISDISVSYSLSVMAGLVVILFFWCWHWLNKGVGIRT